MTGRIEKTRDADTDLTLIWVYHAEKSERAAMRVCDKITATYDTLLAFPHMGRNREELRTGLRSFPSGDYVTFYREIVGGIEIVRVLHGAQDVYSVFPPDDFEEPPAT